MSIPKVSDMLRSLKMRARVQLTPEEAVLGPHLRGNAGLMRALVALLVTRMEWRAGAPEPSDPLDAVRAAARDRELRWLLGRLDAVYTSPVNEPAEEDDEPPA